MIMIMEIYDKIVQSNPDLATVKIATNLNLPTKKISDDQLFTNKKTSK